MKRWNRLKGSLTCASFLVACAKTDPEVKKVGIEPRAPASSSTGMQVASSVPVAGASASTAAPAPPASPKPSESEWAAGRSLTGDGEEQLSHHGGCDATKVREWVRISCKAGEGYPWAGDPLRIRVEKGEASVDVGQSHLVPRPDGAVSLVYRFVEGTDVRATFEMSAGTFTLVSTSNARVGQIGTFYLDEPASLQTCFRQIDPGHDAETQAHLQGQCRSRVEDARKERVACQRACMKETSQPIGTCVRVCSGAEPPPVKPQVEQVALPVEPEIEGAPKPQAWSSAKEIVVTGSDAHGCETKQLREFIRVVCRPNTVTGKALSASWESGTTAATSYAVAGEGAVVLLTRYVDGTAAKAAIRWDRMTATLALEWPAGQKEPRSRGSIKSP